MTIDSELSIIQQTPTPRTRQSLAADMTALGIRAGMLVIAHSAMSQIGWISGGPMTVIQALQDVLTDQGTLVMPSFSDENTDPAAWQAPPVPEAWCQIIRDTMPAFDPRKTATRGMGRIAETFRTWPDVYRSYHPSLSFAAWGKYAETITAQHTLEFPLGDGSPLARLYDLGAYVLLIGVGYGNCTSLHLSEYRSHAYPKIANGGAVLENGQRVWKTYSDYELNVEAFLHIGADFEQNNMALVGNIGSANSRLIPQPALVDFGTSWIVAHQKASSL